MSDRARRAILERRAAFIAAAVASLGTGALGCEGSARACLSAVADEEAKHVSPADAAVAAEPEVGPRPCLTESAIPCLSPPPSTDAGRPRVCLSVVRPLFDAGGKPKPTP